MLRSAFAGFIGVVLAVLAVPAAAQDARTVGRIFFESDQRRILEGIRQGIIDSSPLSGTSLGIEIPDVVFEIPEEEVQPTDAVSGQIIRSSAFTVDGIFRIGSNHVRIRSGDTLLSTEDPEALAAMGLKLIVEPDGRLSVIDAISQQQHMLSRGSTIQPRGGVDARDLPTTRFIIVKR